MMAARAKTFTAICMSATICSCASVENGINPSTVTAAKLETDGIPTLCSSSERALYSCRMEDRQIVSMCLGQGTLHYREGQEGRLTKAISSKPDWSNIHSDFIVGGGGGHQTHVRFSAPDAEYIVFQASPGQLHDIKSPWSGVSIWTQKDPKTGKPNEVSRRCPGEAITDPDRYDAISAEVPDDIKVPGHLAEPEDSIYLAWF